MGKPDSQQRGLAGEYYVASILSRLGYDVGITIGRAKVFDIIALGPAGEVLNMQVKSNYSYNDWLVTHAFDPSENSVVALVRLRKEAAQRPELYFLLGREANELITHKYKSHAPRISRKDVMKKSQDHEFSLIEQLLPTP